MGAAARLKFLAHSSESVSKLHISALANLFPPMDLVIDIVCPTLFYCIPCVRDISLKRLECFRIHVFSILEMFVQDARKQVFNVSNYVEPYKNIS